MNGPAPIPSTPRADAGSGRGTYVLLLGCAGCPNLSAERPGRIDPRLGFHAYVGSALGPGGLRSRIARHLDPTRPIHWHIDPLKRVSRIVEVWYAVDPIRREHAWARALASLSDATIPMMGFGSSDCNCPAHLFHFPTAPRLATFKRAIARTRGAGNGLLRVFRPTSN